MKAHPFICDPSNNDLAFARTRIRRLSRFLADKGLDRKALLRLGRRAARADAALGQRTPAPSLPRLEASARLADFGRIFRHWPTNPRRFSYAFLPMN